MAAYYYNRAREWNKAVTIDTKDRAYLAGSVLDFEKLHPRGPREILKGIWEAEESIGSTWGYSAENPVERFRGAQAVILGCTEITLLVDAADSHNWITASYIVPSSTGGRAVLYRFTVKGDDLFAIAQSWPGSTALIFCRLTTARWLW